MLLLERSAGVFYNYLLYDVTEITINFLDVIVMLNSFLVGQLSFIET